MTAPGLTTPDTPPTGEQAGYAVMLAGPDRLGIPVTVGRWLTDHDCTTADRGRLFSDSTGTLFLRWEFTTPAPAHQLRGQFAAFADMHDLQWTITPLARPRLLLLASREDHVLVYLLSQHAAGLLPADIVGVASNHEDTRAVAAAYGVPFTYIPWPSLRDQDPAGQSVAHHRLATLAKNVRAEGIFLARFMQTLAPWFCQQWYGRLINVHHGDIPAFEGANPIRQALQRGVKGVGASTFYVTAELDKGPLITQEWRHLGHLPPHPSEQDLKRETRLAEIAAAETAIRLHSTARLLLHRDRHGDHVVIM